MRRVPLPEEWRRRAIVIRDTELFDEWFTPGELAVAASFRPKRMFEWKQSRIAAKQLAIDLGLCVSPRDCVIERPRVRVPGGLRHISFSHSGVYAAAAIDDEPVGVDVECARDLKEAAAHLFLSDSEAADMRATGIARRMIHFWAAKEAAWKQRNGAIETLKRVPLKLEAETVSGLRFDQVETFATGDLVVALTRPSGGADSSRR